MITGLQKGRSDTPIAITEGIDIDVCEVKYQFIDYWIEKVKNKEITSEQLENEIIHTHNNVAHSTVMLIQVHKPPRYTAKDMMEILKSNDKQ